MHQISPTGYSDLGFKKCSRGRNLRTSAFEGAASRRGRGWGVRGKGKGEMWRGPESGLPGARGGSQRAWVGEAQFSTTLVRYDR